MDRSYKFRHVNALTGLFILAAVALGIAALIATGRSHQWFTHKFTLDLVLPEQGAIGLSRGNQVFILGLAAGSVEGIIVEPDGRLVARARIQGDFERFIRADSTATIKKTFGVAGDSYVEITRGHGPALPQKKPSLDCKSSEELPTLMDRLLDEVRQEIMPILKKASSGLDQWGKLGAELDVTQQRAQQFVARLDRIAASLEEGKGTAGKLLQDSSLVDEAHKLLTQGRASLGSRSMLRRYASMAWS